ncbi:putative sel1-like repeat-containing protein [Niemeyer virus]|uniref:Putative sel1-like repeat-containing protein R850 n=6 Tax=Mimivirus TaxID=315393 RepID=YR850_MIMIV|nr:putative sel1-like repeat-containing protein [Acanthamoeba polyphaga mimivirus]Q5UP31.1 RecName: Full=Putative sel1-like repeat-containing protein R850 [Acanthamoeba polyphaga mimivirus]AAV51108.1 unknown [Acanthamoeba polyphaga mimivirus]ADO18896.1 putative sel1-like repeat-containing protein [Acanthamoeba polyphaga mimivirus]ALR84506.1 putative sel1-like repeat-containing protein [Niemeyer virus]
MVTMDNSDKIYDLIGSANNNDVDSQNELVRVFVHNCFIRSVLTFAKPFKWNNIVENAIQDSNYTYFILCFHGHKYNRVKYQEIYKKIIDGLFLRISKSSSLDALTYNNLGFIYHNDIFKKNKVIKVISHYCKAVNMNSKHAQYNLATFIRLNYYKQEFVKLLSKTVFKDSTLPISKEIIFKKIYELYKLSASQFNPNAEHSLSTTCEFREFIGQKERDKWLKKSAKNGLSISQYSIGTKYLGGDVTNRKYQKGIIYLKNSAKQGDTGSQISLINIYSKEYGKNIMTNINEMMYWYLNCEQYTSFFMNIFDVFPIVCNTMEIDNKSNEENQNITNIETIILSKIQLLLVKIKYDCVCNNSITITNILDELENKFFKIIESRQKIQNSSSIFYISQMRLVDSVYQNIIDQQNKTGIIPFVKNYLVDEEIYMSIGFDSIEICDQLEILLNNDMYAENIVELLWRLDELCKEKSYYSKILKITNMLENYRSQVITFLEDNLTLRENYFFKKYKHIQRNYF